MQYIIGGLEASPYWYEAKIRSAVMASTENYDFILWSTSCKCIVGYLGGGGCTLCASQYLYAIA